MNKKPPKNTHTGKSNTHRERDTESHTERSENISKLEYCGQNIHEKQHKEMAIETESEMSAESERRQINRQGGRGTDRQTEAKMK